MRSTTHACSTHAVRLDDKLTKIYQLVIIIIKTRYVADKKMFLFKIIICTYYQLDFTTFV